MLVISIGGADMPLWDRSRQVIAEARKAAAQHERVLLLDLQSGFNACAQGQALHWELELTPEDGQLRRTALGLLSTGIATLTGLEPSLREKILRPTRSAEILPRDRFSSLELRSLLGSLQFELDVYMCVAQSASLYF